jgi:hypothetical protein
MAKAVIAAEQTHAFEPSIHRRNRLAGRCVRYSIHFATALKTLVKREHLFVLLQRLFV